jgi:hypothetical protein
MASCFVYPGRYSVELLLVNVTGGDKTPRFIDKHSTKRGHNFVNEVIKGQPKGVAKQNTMRHVLGKRLLLRNHLAEEIRRNVRADRFAATTTSKPLVHIERELLPRVLRNNLEALLLLEGRILDLFSEIHNFFQRHGARTVRY